MIRASYVLPLRWTDTGGSEDLTLYLGWLAARVQEVIVVDGSPPEVFEHHAALWSSFLRHERPADDLKFLNGKVNGVTTGLRMAAHERVVVADDDVRYDEQGLERVVDLLAGSEMVAVETFFDPTPWHALWETGRLLLNRAFGIRYPVTFGIRRSAFLSMGGYDGDVLFENLELMRTLEAWGGRVACPADLFARHLPPDRRWFWSQRVRQAYDDLAVPVRMSVWLAVVPASAAALARRSTRSVLLGAAAAIATAEVGRRRPGGTGVFPAAASLFAPVWLLERGICSWIALWHRWVRGGVPYRGTRLLRAATSPARLRARVGRARRTPAP